MIAKTKPRSKIERTIPERDWMARENQERNKDLVAWQKLLKNPTFQRELNAAMARRDALIKYAGEGNKRRAEAYQARRRRYEESTRGRTKKK